MADVQPMAPKKGYAVIVSSFALDAVSSSTKLGRDGCVIALRHREGDEHTAYTGQRSVAILTVLGLLLALCDVG